MRWSDLLADLEGQLDAAERADLAAEVADRTRGEVGRVLLDDRFAAAAGARVTLLLPGGPLPGTVVDSGPGWALVADGGTEVLAATQRVGVAGLPLAGAAGGPSAVRFDLRRALRLVVRDRSPVDLHLVGGLVLHGTPDRVGADHLDLAEHPPGEPRRAAAVRRVVSVPVDAVVAAVRRGAGGAA